MKSVPATNKISDNQKIQNTKNKKQKPGKEKCFKLPRKIKLDGMESDNKMCYCV